MKVHGRMFQDEKPTDAHLAARQRQNGKRSIALRAAALKKQGMKRSKRRLAARWS